MTLDRSAIMRDAWRRYRDAKRIGLAWDFARCLRQAWIAAKLREQFPRQRYNPDRRPEKVALMMSLIKEIHDETLQALAR